MNQIDFTKYRLDKVSDLEPFIKYDRSRYLDFNYVLVQRLKSLHNGEVLSVYSYPPRQYNLFVKLCCWLSFLTRNFNLEERGYYFEMLPDCSGCRKITVKTKRNNA